MIGSVVGAIVVLVLVRIARRMNGDVTLDSHLFCKHEYHT